MAPSCQIYNISTPQHGVEYAEFSIKPSRETYWDRGGSTVVIFKGDLGKRDVVDVDFE